MCEVLNEDGTMARLPDLRAYCDRHGFKMCTIADLIEYRRRTEKLVTREIALKLPTDVRRRSTCSRTRRWWTRSRTWP